MTRVTCEFLAVDGLDGVYAARARNLNCFALRLRHGGVCLYNPIRGISDAVSKQLNDLGGVSVILAPNHYHNMGLLEHAKAFPGAAIVCSAAAEPRLRKVTELNFEPIETLKAYLAENHEILEPEGLKTGEVWVQISESETNWIVADAFSSELRSLGVIEETATLLRTFPKYGVKDADDYKHWVLDLMESSSPTRLLSCHGSPVVTPGLKEQLSALLNSLDK